MKLSPDDFEEIVDAARAYLQISRADSEARCPTRSTRVGVAFADALVKLASSLQNCCVIGVRCGRHVGVVHGQEAEELRAGIEQILKNTADVEDEEAPDVLRALRKSLIFLLDNIDARDSLAFREREDADLSAEEIAAAVVQLPITPEEWAANVRAKVDEALREPRKPSPSRNSYRWTEIDGYIVSTVSLPESYEMQYETLVYSIVDGKWDSDGSSVQRVCKVAANAAHDAACARLRGRIQ